MGRSLSKFGKRSRFGSVVQLPDAERRAHRMAALGEQARASDGLEQQLRLDWLATLRTDRRNRGFFAWLAFTVVLVCLLLVVYVVVRRARSGQGLTESELVALLTTFFASVVGPWRIVLKYYFDPKHTEAQLQPARSAKRAARHAPRGRKLRS